VSRELDASLVSLEERAQDPRRAHPCARRDTPVPGSETGQPGAWRGIPAARSVA